MNKKGFNIMDVPTLVITLGVIAIILGLMATITQNVAVSQCTYGSNAMGQCLNATGGRGGNLGMTSAYNVTYMGVESVQDLADWQPTWVVIIASAVVIGIVGAYLFFRPK